MRAGVLAVIALLAFEVPPALSQANRASQASPADLIERAVQAMGGDAALRGLRNKSIDFYTAAFGLGQEETPLSPARASIATGKIQTDYAGKRQITTQEIRLVNGQVNRQRRVTLTTMSMLENNGALQMDPAGVSAGLERALSLQPERILLSALEHPTATALPSRTLRGETVDGVRLLLGPDTVNLWFDRPTGLPVASESLTDDPVLGDRTTITWYTRWQDAGGLKLPRQVDTEVNGRLLSHNIVTGAAINQDLGEASFAIPDSMSARAPRAPAGPPAVTVNLVQLGPGVWRAEGGNHHSLVLEQGQNLLVVEGPLNAARTRAVLDTLRSRFPGRTVSGVVATHHHHDHSGGLREYMAQGIPVIAHSRNVSFVQGVAQARKTVAPDGLSRGGRTPPVRAVADTLVLGTGEGQVVLYPLASAHVEGLLAAWVPSARLLFTSDVLSPQANQPLLRPGSLELVTFARLNGLHPSRFVGGHGVVVEWSAVEAAAR